jgi:hypothetical protein
VFHALPCDVDTLLSFLEENYPFFYSDLHDMAQLTQIFSDIDALLLEQRPHRIVGLTHTKYDTQRETTPLETTAALVAMHAVQHYNRHPSPPRFQPLYKPLHLSLHRQCSQQLALMQQLIFSQQWTLQLNNLALTTEYIPYLGRCLRAHASQARPLFSSRQSLQHQTLTSSVSYSSLTPGSLFFVFVLQRILLTNHLTLSLNTLNSSSLSPSLSPLLIVLLLGGLRTLIEQMCDFSTTTPTPTSLLHNNKDTRLRSQFYESDFYISEYTTELEESLCKQHVHRRQHLETELKSASVQALKEDIQRFPDDEGGTTTSDFIQLPPFSFNSNNNNNNEESIAITTEVDEPQERIFTLLDDIEDW